MAKLVNNLFTRDFLAELLRTMESSVADLSGKLYFCQELIFGNNRRHNDLGDLRGLGAQGDWGGLGGLGVLADRVDLVDPAEPVEPGDWSELAGPIAGPILLRMGWRLAKERPFIKGPKGVRAFFSSAGAAAANVKGPSEPKGPRENENDVVVAFVPDQALDDGQIAQNPYLFLLASLRRLRVPWGFLVNGHDWLLAAAGPGEKRLTFNLAEIVSQEDRPVFALFWGLFAVANYRPLGANPAPAAVLLAQDEDRRLKIERDLKAVIKGAGGQKGLLEETGRALYRSQPGLGLKEIGENASRFLFRLIFLAHFEDGRYLENLWPTGQPTLWGFLADLKINPEDNSFAGWERLKGQLGLVASDIKTAFNPLFGSALFDPRKTPALKAERLFSDRELFALLSRLLARPGEPPQRRDFAALSPFRLGAIFESLMEFEFRLAERPLALAEIRRGQDKMKDKKLDKNQSNKLDKKSDRKLKGYFGREDLWEMGQKGERIEILAELAPGDLYLANSRANRKAGGVYYTSERLAWPLAARGVERLLGGPFLRRSLLEIRLLDCACGTGNLLAEALESLAFTAYARIEKDPALAKALAAEIKALGETRIKSKGGFEPLDERAVLKRLLLRTVVYGVDLSPLAADLAKAALGLAAFVPGAGLAYLEPKIKAGDALLGLSPGATSPLGLSVEAGFLTKETEELRENYKLLNQKYYFNDEKYQEFYEATILTRTNNINNYFNIINYCKILSQVDKGKAKNSRAYLGEGNWLKAAALAEEAEETRPGAKYRDMFSFFNWEAEFPLAFSDPDDRGFHLLIGNPPWDKTKFEEPAFFAQYRPDYRSLPGWAKKNLAKNLMAWPAIREKRDLEKTLAGLRNALLMEAYPLNRRSGDGNLFRFFAEKGLSLLAPLGNLNYIVPTGLLTEDNSTLLRRHILKNFRLVRFDGFENRKMIFPAVDSRYKFGLAQIENARDPKQKALTRFRLTDPSSLANDEGVCEYPLSSVVKTSPKRWAYLDLFGGQRDLKLLSRLYEKFSPLSPDWLDFKNELHATHDQSLWSENSAPGRLPLYQGAMIWQYQAKAQEPRQWVDPGELDERLFDSEVAKIRRDLKGGFSHKDSPKTGQGVDLRAILSFLGLAEKNQLRKYFRPGRDFPRLALRAIARDTNERTLVAALLPKGVVAQNSLWVSSPGQYRLSQDEKNLEFRAISLSRLLFAQALFNSLPLDWVIRASVGMNVNKTYLSRLPLPQPADEELAANDLYRSIVRDSGLLSLAGAPGALVELREFLGLAREEPIVSENRIYLLRAGLDLKVARLYGLTPEDLRYFLASFRIFLDKRPKYLEALEALEAQEAQRSLRKSKSP